MDKRGFLLISVFTVFMFFVHHWFMGDNPSVKPPVEQVVEVTNKELTQENIENTEAVAASLSKNEEFYVLENEYQQVVFSNIGGAIAELNLPFQSKQNQSSVVKPIGFDKTIESKYAQNAYFPIQSYYIAGETGPQKPKFGGYTPMLRRDLKESSGKTSYYTPPRFYALSVISTQDHNLALAKYKMKRLEKDLIEFELSQGSRKIVKTFSFAKTESSTVPYTLNMTIKIEGDGKNLYLTSGIPEIEIMSSNSASPDIKYKFNRNQKAVIEKVKLPKDMTEVKNVNIDWISNSNGFFGIILDPLSEVSPGLIADFIPGVLDPTRLSVIDKNSAAFPSEKYPGYLVKIPLKQNAKPMQIRMFAGPFDNAILASVDKALTDKATGFTPDYSEAQSPQGWFTFISAPFAKFLYSIMKFFYNFTKSWGLSIILLTIVLKLILYPLNNWSMRSMSRMQVIGPEIASIRKKFSKDPKRANLEVMQLYKEKKANPLSGCLPLVIQMPFLFGMFDLLKTSFALRGTSFIPGWINDLAAPDTLFSWGYNLPFLGTEFHLLPFINGGLMFLQQKASALMNKHKVVDPETQKQTNMTGTIMTVVFTFLFYNFPSGLNIYWISSTALGVLQQWLISSQMNKELANEKVRKA